MTCISPTVVLLKRFRRQSLQSRKMRCNYSHCLSVNNTEKEYLPNSYNLRVGNIIDLDCGYIRFIREVGIMWVFQPGRPFIFKCCADARYRGAVWTQR